jgi:ATP synthase F1 complex assembly factor 1
MIWNEYHHAKPHTVSTVLTTPQYHELLSKGKGAPMYIFPVPKGEAPAHLVLVSQNQDKSFVLTFLGDYQKNPTTATPYMVLTCFDELIDTKGIALLRGDLLSHLDEDEGYTIMTTLLNRYLRETGYENIRKFNNEPNSFKYEEYIRESLAEFAMQKAHHIKNKGPKVILEKIKKYGHKTDKELNIFKGGAIR